MDIFVQLLKLSKTCAAVFLLLAVSTPAQSKDCKKGQPCGNSCISWKKICRIGTGSPDPVIIRQKTPVKYSPKDPVVEDNSSKTFLPSASLDSNTSDVFEVINDQVEVYSSPDENSQVIGTLRVKSVVVSFGTKGSWVKVLFNGKIGWINSMQLKKL